MTMPELPDMGDPTPQAGPTQSQYSYYRNALMFFGVVSPWVFVYVSTRNPSLVWLSVLNLIGMYTGFYIIVRAWRRNQTRRMYVALASSLACLVVCTSLFKVLNGTATWISRLMPSGPLRRHRRPAAAFNRCTKAFTDPHPCAVLFDRLSLNSTIIKTGTDSYRRSSPITCPQYSATGTCVEAKASLCGGLCPVRSGPIQSRGRTGMTTLVPRHNVPADRVRSVESLVKSTEDVVDMVVEHPHTFNLALNSAVRSAKAHCALDANAALIETWEAWVAAMQIGSALFRSAASPEATVDCLISGKVRTIPSTGPASYADAGNWLTAFYLALVCREEGRLTALSNVSISLLRESGAVYDEYIYDWVDTLQTYWKQGSALGDKLVAAIKGTDPEVLQVADRSLMLRVLYPPLNLFYRVVRGDGERFNVELVKALESHNEYWTAEESKAAQVSGLVALGPLAMACLAYDSGIAIEVESGYIPKYLLERGRVGDFPA
ncbi:immunity 49 family protein [Streptomyces sp. NPDC093591]|uniref:immunity 49 family protein n=1 Tax=Streptomyces sp. NPDC093591 TaxID=3366044 RepID=UPI0037FF7275